MNLLKRKGSFKSRTIFFLIPIFNQFFSPFHESCLELQLIEQQSIRGLDKHSPASSIRLLPRRVFESSRPI